jgi:NADPH:quinone reductase-like Zn-dependent oxidoreductase
VTTCSPKNFDFVKSYGADEAFDYKSPTCVDDIRAYTNKSLRHVLDTITEAKSMKICYACIGRAGGRYTCLEMYPDFGHTRKTVKPEMVMGLAISGRQIALDWGYESDPNPEFRKFGKR